MTRIARLTTASLLAGILLLPALGAAAAFSSETEVIESREQGPKGTTLQTQVVVEELELAEDASVRAA